MGFRDLTDLNCDNVEFENYILASDDQGKLLKTQIVDYMQNKKGLEIAENLLTEFGNVIVNRALANCLDFKNIKSISQVVYQNPGGFT